MNIKTPPGTVPLMLFDPDRRKPSSQDDWNKIQFMSISQHGFPHEPESLCGHPLYFCQNIGFRVVDEPLFDAWLCSQAIRPNVHHIEHEPVSSFEVEWKDDLYEALGLAEAALCQQGLQATYPEVVAKAREALKKARGEKA